MLRTAPLRLYSVKGYENRINDVIYCPPIRNGFNSVVVFFGGDMQDFSENMQSHRDSKNYLKWNLEDCTLRLRKKFSTSHLINIRPSRIEFKTLSCYGNFVPSNSCGAPNHVPMHFALKHLETLLENITEKLENMSDDELIESTKNYKATNDETNLNNTFERRNLSLSKCDLTAIGFSKGCVVLNQFLYEFHHLKTDENQHFIEQFKEMYWLDGGHSGGKNTWITSKPLLDTLSKLGINIHVHVTPYQIQDDRRPWIRKEEKLFSDSLKRLNASIFRSVHFEDVQPNLSTHFEVLNTFKDDEQF